MKRITLLMAVAVLGACAAVPDPEPVAPGVPTATAPASQSAVAPPPAPPPEFPAVLVRLKRIDGRFVAEVVDVRGAEPDPRPLVGEARRDAVRRLETLLGDRARVVDRDS